MGLCKCPKRKVTNLFCFEHRVNVCETCLVRAHRTCVVQSYLRWLRDSDYSPACALCARPLPARETVRLVCYDVFHWSCLAGRARAGGPGGLGCPTCGGPLLPPPNLRGPVADALRSRLATAPWARPGLGLPPIEDSDPPPEEPDGSWDAPETPEESPPSPPPTPPSPPPHSVIHLGAEAQGRGPRKPLGGRGNRDPPPEEEKYRRRPRRGGRVPPRVAAALAAAGALGLLLLLALGGAGPGGGAELEPRLHPHVRVGP